MITTRSSGGLGSHVPEGSGRGCSWTGGQGGGRYPGFMSSGGGGTLPCDLSHDVFDVTCPFPPVDRQTPVKTLPSPNFVCGH